MPGITIKFVNVIFKDGIGTCDVEFNPNYSLTHTSGYCILAQAQANVHVFVPADGIKDDGYSSNGKKRYILTVRAYTSDGLYTGTTVVSMHIPIKVTV